MPWGTILCKCISILIPKCQAVAGSKLTRRQLCSLLCSIVGINFLEVAVSICMKKAHITWQMCLFFSIYETEMLLLNLMPFQQNICNPNLLCKTIFRGKKKKRKSHALTHTCISVGRSIHLSMHTMRVWIRHLGSCKTGNHHAQT